MCFLNTPLPHAVQPDEHGRPGRRGGQRAAARPAEIRWGNFLVGRGASPIRNRKFELSSEWTPMHDKANLLSSGTVEAAGTLVFEEHSVSKLIQMFLTVHRCLSQPVFTLLPAAVYKDDKGQVHTFSPVCPHLVRPSLSRALCAALLGVLPVPSSFLAGEEWSIDLRCLVCVSSLCGGCANTGVLSSPAPAGLRAPVGPNREEL